VRQCTVDVQCCQPGKDGWGGLSKCPCTLDRDYDVIHLGACVVKSKKTGQFPLDFDQLRLLVKENFGK